MVAIGVAKGARTKICRGGLHRVEFDSNAVGNTLITQTVSPLTNKNVRERLAIGVVDDKGESLSAPSRVGSMDLPAKCHFKAIQCIARWVAATTHLVPRAFFGLPAMWYPLVPAPETLQLISVTVPFVVSNGDGGGITGLSSGADAASETSR